MKSMSWLYFKKNDEKSVEMEESLILKKLFVAFDLRKEVWAQF